MSAGVIAVGARLGEGWDVGQNKTATLVLEGAGIWGVADVVIVDAEDDDASVKKLSARIVWLRQEVALSFTFHVLRPA